MFKIFFKLFPKAEISDCIRIFNLYKNEIKSLKSNNDEHLLYLYNNAVINIESDVLNTLQQNPKIIVETIKKENISPEIVVNNLIYSHCFNQLTNGYNHSYRGQLNWLGKAYFEIAKLSLSKMIMFKQIDKVQKNNILKSLEENISSIG